MVPVAKVIFYKHKVYKDGTSPIIIQAIINRRPVRIVVDRVREDQWLPSRSRVSGRKHPEADRINDKIEEALRDANDKLAKGQTLGGRVVNLASFTEFYLGVIAKYKTDGQASRHSIHCLVLAQLQDFLGKTEILFADIRESSLYSFSLYLTNVRKNGKNSVREKMNSLATVFKQARKRKLTIEDPFLNLVFQKEKTIKSKLTVLELKKLQTLDLPEKLAVVRDFFLASVYLRGIRASDLLLARPGGVRDGRFYYIENKTGKHHNPRLHPEAVRLLLNWKDRSAFGYSFPLLKWAEDEELTPAENKFIFKSKVKKAIAFINYWLLRIGRLAEIDKRLSIHVARHTFGKLTIDKVKNPRLSMELMGHSTLSAHQTYVLDIQDDEELDSAADEILDF